VKGHCGYWLKKDESDKTKPEKFLLSFYKPFGASPVECHEVALQISEDPTRASQKADIIYDKVGLH
jgi:hypothetical protein